MYNLKFFLKSLLQELANLDGLRKKQCSTSLESRRIITTYFRINMR